MKKIILLLLLSSLSLLLAAQEIYTPGCLYDSYGNPLPVYWVNNNIELLGVPANTYGEAVSIIQFKGKILVFGNMIIENKKVPVVWEDTSRFTFVSFPWEYNECTIKKAFVIGERVYIIGGVKDNNDHHHGIVWQDIYHYKIITEENRETFIYDLDEINDEIVTAGYTKSYITEEWKYYISDEKYIDKDIFDEDSVSYIHKIKQIGGDISLRES